jgi:hypothetical protein
VTGDTRQRWAFRQIRTDRLIYTTVTLMSVLIVYDGWAALTFGGVAAVIVGPILAIFLGHIFGADLGTRVELGRPLTGTERRTLLADESRFLLILVPPLTILALLTVAGLTYTRIIQVIVATGVLSLGFWGGLAGRRAGLTGWRFVASIVFGLVVGGLILAIQALLRPGHGTLRALAAFAGH